MGADHATTEHAAISDSRRAHCPSVGLRRQRGPAGCFLEDRPDVTENGIEDGADRLAGLPSARTSDRPGFGENFAAADGHLGKPLFFRLTSYNISNSCPKDKIKYMMLDENILTPEQCLGARAMLGLSRSDLAKMAKVSQATLADFEAGKRQPYQRTLAEIQRTLEAAGIIFLAEGETTDGGRGVRLKIWTGGVL